MSNENFIRRLKLIESMDKLMREAIYHRNHDDDEKLEPVKVWNWDEQEGESEATF